ncbi:OprO/OprP family phosphate-selective porin [Dokdonella sp.]|uniref:OprO/OprP family phosphate-selective porin n=1 Tax=Dokdonella sp. TaxID=2291710 RepID=UPI002F3E85A0
MKLRHAIAAALMCGIGTNAMAYDVLNDWPTKFKTSDGYEFGVKGLFQYDVNTFSGDTENPATGAEIFDDANAWRRKEVNVYGKTPWGLDFNIGYDITYAGGVHAAWIDNFIRYSNKEAGDFRIGQFKTPVGWEETISSGATTFMERALPVQAANMGRRIGADWTYTGIPNWLLYLAYFKGGDLNGDNDGDGPAARVVWNPFNRQPGAGSREQSEVLHLGLAYSTEDRDATTDGRGIVSNPSARFRAKPEAGLLGTRLVDTGSLAFPGTIKRLGLEGAWIHGPLLVQGEYLSFSADPRGKPSFEGDGCYVQGSWVLTGESRPYSKGTIGNVRPINDFGAFEVAVRYSHLDLNDAPVLGGKQEDWTIGANWYLGQHFKLQANYIMANSTKHYGAPINGEADVDPRVFEVRAQIAF